MIDYSKFPIFMNHISTIEETSYDKTNGVNMISSKIKVINFDDVIEEYSKIYGSSSSLFCSVDALSKTTSKNLFIEFKNGVFKNRDIKYKILGTLLTFCSITGTDIEFTRKNVDFILVYNDVLQPKPSNSISRNNISQSLLQLSNQRYVGFGIDNYYKLFFNDAFAFSISEFNRYIGNIVSL